ncbi:MAG: 2-phosphosulfolactate phosphatase [Bacteroidales bacterium]|jgi:2-phosphosulfolactate phosphatase|nr:2-phosphosulfolactate phosphatase [Bacteroidales bacterium]MDD4385100.1 2-phosphosulfolactate phosphatase [Bacteroidales bacterium]MDY0197541.1 2-phosphosulfolactate phosphatase [Tenuifilaceae bacterium]
MDKRTIEVCFNPENLEYFDISNSHVIVVDVLRATSAICAAFANGAKSIIPIPTIEEARIAKEKGYLVAAERDGKTLNFADFGNSPFNFTADRVAGKDIAYSTTNGTKAIVKASDGLSVAIGSFLNLAAIAKWAKQKQTGNVMILCAGWKGRFCLEDALFAGALAKILLSDSCFTTHSDSVQASLQLWSLAQGDIFAYLELVAQRHRLKKLGLDDVLEYCFTPNSTDKVPELVDGKLVVL